MAATCDCFYEFSKVRYKKDENKILEIKIFVKVI